LLEFKTEAPDD